MYKGSRFGIVDLSGNRIETLIVIDRNLLILRTAIASAGPVSAGIAGPASTSAKRKGQPTLSPQSVCDSGVSRSSMFLVLVDGYSMFVGRSLIGVNSVHHTLAEHRLALLGVFNGVSPNPFRGIITA
jgi:hypothetical protein